MKYFTLIIYEDLFFQNGAFEMHFLKFWIPHRMTSEKWRGKALQKWTQVYHILKINSLLMIYTHVLLIFD